MKGIYSKLIVLCLVAGLAWFGSFAIGDTKAYFSASQSIGSNSFTVGSLNLSVKELGGFSLRLNSHNKAVKNVQVRNQGSSNIKYKVKAGNPTGELCQYLDIKAKVKGDIKYQGPLVGLVSEESYLASSSDPENWTFKIYFNGDGDISRDTSCSFDLLFRAWQANMDDPDRGFSDTERISATVDSIGKPKANVVLNEVLPNPEGDDDQQGLQGEWVEFYNKGKDSQDMTDWYIRDATGNIRGTVRSTTTYNGQTEIGGKNSGREWLVLLIDGAQLNNTGDTVKLYNSAGELQDSYAFGDSDTDDDSDSHNTPGGDNQNPAGEETAGNEGKSYARIPDGSKKWKDPVPTPGAPNKLKEDKDLGSASRTMKQDTPEPKSASSSPEKEKKPDTGQDGAGEKTDDTDKKPDKDPQKQEEKQTEEENTANQEGEDKDQAEVGKKDESSKKKNNPDPKNKESEVGCEDKNTSEEDTEEETSTSEEDTETDSAGDKDNKDKDTKTKNNNTDLKKEDDGAEEETAEEESDGSDNNSDKQSNDQ